MTARAPKQQALALSCNCHFHILGVSDGYPMSAGRGYTPPEAWIKLWSYRASSAGTPFADVATNAQALQLLRRSGASGGRTGLTRR